jgi:hypothetical protein
MIVMRRWVLISFGVLLVLGAVGAAAFYFLVWRAGLEESDYITLTNPGTSLGIVRQPKPADLRHVFWHSNRLPAYDPKSEASFQVDVRSRDLSGIDVRGRSNDLLHACFDSQTIWPARLPAEFNPVQIMTTGKNPGLQVRELHRRNITGHGVGLAIIDQELLTDHREYRERLRLYEEIHIPSKKNPSAQMHGPAVASIAVGRETGVAPGAELYYIACENGRYLGFERMEWDLAWLGKAMDRILDLNQTLPVGSKIRVISISLGWVGARKTTGYTAAEQALQRARRENVFVVTPTLGETYGLPLCGLEREPGQDPDDWRVFSAGQWWRHKYLNKEVPEKMLLVPMTARCTASPTGNSDYVFYRDGGESWSVPYLAGLYALACEVRPDITPDIFLQTAAATGDIGEFTWEGKKYPLQVIVNPIRIMERLQGKPERF